MATLMCISLINSWDREAETTALLFVSNCRESSGSGVWTLAVAVAAARETVAVGVATTSTST